MGPGSSLVRSKSHQEELSAGPYLLSSMAGITPGHDGCILGSLHTREAQGESRERIAAALAAAGTGTFRWDVETDVVEWDDTLASLFGLPAGSPSRSLESFLSAVHPDDRICGDRHVPAQRAYWRHAGHGIPCRVARRQRALDRRQGTQLRGGQRSAWLCHRRVCRHHGQKTHRDRASGRDAAPGAAERDRALAGLDPGPQGAAADGDRCRDAAGPRKVRRVLLQHHDRRGRCLSALHLVGRSPRGVRAPGQAACDRALRAHLTR